MFARGTVKCPLTPLLLSSCNSFFFVFSFCSSSACSCVLLPMCPPLVVSPLLFHSHLQSSSKVGTACSAPSTLLHWATWAVSCVRNDVSARPVLLRWFCTRYIDYTAGPVVDNNVLVWVSTPLYIYAIDEQCSDRRLRKAIAVQSCSQADMLTWFCRQGGKDQTKKGPNMKLGPQGDKKGLGQDMRKDGSLDGGHHLKVSLSWHKSAIICWTNITTSN